MNVSEEKNKRYTELPDHVSDWLGSEEIMTQIYSLQEKFRLTPEQRKAISRLILDVFLGFVPQTKLVTTIAEKLSIPEPWAEPLAQQLNAEIIEPHKDWILPGDTVAADPHTAVAAPAQQKAAAPVTKVTPAQRPPQASVASLRPVAPPAYTPKAATVVPPPRPVPVTPRATEPSFYGPRPQQRPSYNSMLDVPRYGAPMPTSNERAAVPPTPPTPSTPHNLPTQSTPPAATSPAHHAPRAPFELPPDQPFASAPAPTPTRQWGSAPPTPPTPEPPPWAHAQTPPAPPGEGARGHRVFDRGSAAAFDHDQWKA